MPQSRRRHASLASLVRLLARFRRDEDGAFMVIFAVMGLALVAFAGSVIDFTTLEQRRARVQAALDSAVLGLHPTIRTDTEQKIGENVLALLEESMLSDPEATVRIERIDVDLSSGSLQVTTRLSSPTYFVALLGVPAIESLQTSEATRKSQRLEIAMVLDNSGSMADSNRMAHLQQAARNANATFFEDASPGDPKVFVGIVPFTQYVNVGPGNANAAWIDRTGRSSIADDNFVMDAKSPIPGFDRISLFQQLSNETWRGCVEARVTPYDTDDTPPAHNAPNTLFVPMMAPDEPDTEDRYGRAIFNNSYIEDQRGQCEKPGKNQTFSDRVLQERMCKYKGAAVAGRSMEYARGPNADCPTNPLTPLSSNPATVRAAIDAMYPQGGTNIAQGAIWGLHMLTPGLPLTEGAVSDDNVNKVMILMTDGDNFAAADGDMNGATFYSAYGYPYNRRLGKPGDSSATLQSLMNQRLLATCTSAKQLGIKVYTIGLSMGSTTTRTMLANCSSGNGHAFLPKLPSELNAIFDEIADQLSVLRLSR